jgi:hypothetical protein
MTKQTKMFLGLGAIAVALYFVLKPKGSKGQKTCADDEVLIQVQCVRAPCPPPRCEKKLDMDDSSMDDYSVNCADGTRDVANGVSLPCQGHGGVLPTR